MPLIACRALGPLDVSIDGVPAPPELLWRKHLALLLYLLRSPRRTRGREHLIGLLWPESPEPNARQSLNEALRILRRKCGDETVQASSDQVCLGPQFSLDVDEFDAALAVRDLARAASLAAGEFAEGFAVRGATGFDDWLDAERRHWRGKSVDALVQQAEVLLAQGTTDPATTLAERALSLDPLSERAARSVMRSRILSGDLRGAAECGHQFGERLRTELGVSASAELRQLERVATAAPAAPGRGQLAARAARTPFFGRESELTGLLDAWGDCQSGRHATLGIVSGDAGSGISRLLEEVSARVMLDGGSVAGLRAVDADQDHEGSLVTGLAASGLRGLAGVATAAPAALATFGRRFAGWAEQYAGAPGDAELDLVLALAEVVRATAEERPLLLVIDDAHRLDAVSLRMLPQLLRATHDLPVMVLIGVASDAATVELDELRRLVGHMPGVTVTIGALPTRALSELAAALLPAYTAGELDRLVRRVSTDTAGLALLAVEVLRAVSRGLELQGTGKAWPETAKTLDQTLPADLPDAVVAAIRINARRLSRPAQAVLVAASLTRERAPAELLAFATELDRSAVDEALDELEWHRWLVADGRGYSFAARVVQRVLARDLLTAGRRRKLVARIEGWHGDGLA